tara:strand:- start:1710 stop:3410 length:1701 start_codon:yes stop_codon:yes gene_type:complete
MKDLQDDRSFDLPDGYELRDDGIFLQADPENDNSAPIWLCSPLKVTAVVHDAHNMRWGRLIVAKNAAGKTHEWVMSAVDITKVAKISEQLLSRGLKLSSIVSDQKALSRLLSAWQPAKTVLLTDKVGWADATFQTFTLSDGRTVGQKQAIYAPLDTYFELKNDGKAGDLDTWKQNVAQRACGNPVLVAAISLSFAGPLLRILGLNGFGLHLKGQSSTGKTTALSVATSVWGGSDLIGTWRTTENALEGKAALANDSLLALDELGEASAKAASEAAYMLANGQGKRRASARGSAPNPLEWKVVFLSTGEISIAEKLAEAGIEQMSGQSVRILDLTVDGRDYGIFDNLHGEGRAADFSNGLKRACTESYGVAGPAFAEKLISYGSEYRQIFSSLLTKYTAHILTSENGSRDGINERVATQFALIALAGDMATIFGLTGWEKNSALFASTAMFALWKKSRLNPLSQGEILRRIEAFVISNASRLTCVGSSPVTDHIGWQNDSCFMFDREGWAEIHAGLNVTLVAKRAKAFGILAGADGENLKAKAPAGIPNRPRLYMVNRSALERHNLK